jgi:hypothetical protein
MAEAKNEFGAVGFPSKGSPLLAGDIQRRKNRGLQPARNVQKNGTGASPARSSVPFGTLRRYT